MEKYILITGATSGIGLSLTKVFGEQGYNLVLVSRNEEKLNKLKEELLEQFNIDVTVITQDLSLPNAAFNVYNQVKQKNVNIDILCNNAGIGLYGDFDEIEVSKYHQLIQLNIVSLMDLSYYFLSDMKKRNQGCIINIGSTGSFVPGPYMAVYYASKAFVLSFTEAISMEVKNTNIKVICVCPGPTNTAFFQNATDKDINLIENIKSMSSDDVAKFIVKSVEKAKVVLIPGFKNKLAIFGTRFISRKLNRKIIYNIQHKRGKDKI